RPARTRPAQACGGWPSLPAERGGVVEAPSGLSQSLRKNRRGAARAAEVLTRGFLHLPSSFSPRGLGVPLLARAKPAPPASRGEVREGGGGGPPTPCSYVILSRLQPSGMRCPRAALTSAAEPVCS